MNALRVRDLEWKSTNNPYKQVDSADLTAHLNTPNKE